MIIIDTALEKLEREGKPIRVGMIGAGFMAKGIALQITKYTKGMRLVAVANRTVNKAENMLDEIGLNNIAFVSTATDLEKSVKSGKVAITDNPFAITESNCVDVIVEVTGSIEYAAQIVMSAIDYKKHVVLMNAELDGTVGPILKTYADKAGVVVTNADGDQPGVIMNLYRFVRGIGVRPVLCGNIKGLHDPYRNPTTQQEFAKKWGQNPTMVTSFADGSKISFEQTIVANATGMKVAKRGMHGFNMVSGTQISEALKLYPLEELVEGPGIVDYVVGAVPSPGVFVFGYHDNPIQKHYLNLYKLGEGPLYCFYTPYHLCHFEVPNTIARAAIFRDATITPIAGPVVEVVALAKKDLSKGEIIDEIGGYCVYGVCENHKIARKENLLPVGLAEDAILNKDIPKDQVITFDDVKIQEGKLSMKLWKEQTIKFKDYNL